MKIVYGSIFYTFSNPYRYIIYTLDSIIAYTLTVCVSRGLAAKFSNIDMPLSLTIYIHSLRPYLVFIFNQFSLNKRLQQITLYENLLNKNGYIN